MNSVIALCGLLLAQDLPEPPPSLVDLYEEVLGCADNTDRNGHIILTEPDIERFHPAPSLEWIAADAANVQTPQEGDDTSIPHFILLPHVEADHLPVAELLATAIRFRRAGALPLAQLPRPLPHHQESIRNFWCALSLELCPFGWILPNGGSAALLTRLKSGVLEPGLYVMSSWQPASGWSLPARRIIRGDATVLPLRRTALAAGGEAVRVHEVTKADFSRHALSELDTPAPRWRFLGREFRFEPAGDGYRLEADPVGTLLYAITGTSLKVWSRLSGQPGSLTGMATKGFAWFALVLGFINIAVIVFIALIAQLAKAFRERSVR